MQWRAIHKPAPKSWRNQARETMAAFITTGTSNTWLFIA